MHSHPLFSVIVALHLKHFVICALFGHQLLMGAHLGDLAAGHKQNPVAKTGGRQPVGNKEREFAVGQFAVF